MRYTNQRRQMHCVFRLSVCVLVRRSNCSFVLTILLPWYLMRGLSKLNGTWCKYSIAPTDDLIRFWRSKVKGQGHNRLSKWWSHPRRYSSIFLSTVQSYKDCMSCQCEWHMRLINQMDSTMQDMLQCFH